MRQALEAWCLERWPSARIVHELVVGRGTVRADMAAIGADSFAAIEIKSGYDNASRLMHQAGMFRLVAPELWLATTPDHEQDVALIRYLLPSIGFIRMSGATRYGVIDKVDVVNEPAPWTPHLPSMLQLLWVSELYGEARRHGLQPHQRDAHAKLVDRLLRHLSPGEVLRGVCRQLRARDAAWRADPPITADDSEGDA